MTTALVPSYHLGFRSEQAENDFCNIHINFERAHFKRKMTGIFNEDFVNFFKMAGDLYYDHYLNKKVGVPLGCDSLTKLAGKNYLYMPEVYATAAEVKPKLTTKEQERLTEMVEIAESLNRTSLEETVKQYAENIFDEAIKLPEKKQNKVLEVYPPISLVGSLTPSINLKEVRDSISMIKKLAGYLTTKSRQHLVFYENQLYKSVEMWNNLNGY